MAVQQKTINIVLLALLGLALLIGTIALVKGSKTPPITPANPNPQPKGFGKALGELISGATIGGWLKGLFGGNSNYSKANCDPDREGYNKNGVLDPSCGAGAGACNPFECDPNNLGKNMCGDAGFPCACGDPNALC